MLPEYVPTLPPRKRARTEAEKEERRLQRTIRNRRAAQTSRVRKRKYVEVLESYVKKLEQNCKTLEGNLSRLAALSDIFTLEQAHLVKTEDIEPLKKEVLAVSHSKGNAAVNSSRDSSSVPTPIPNEDSIFSRVPNNQPPDKPKPSTEQLLYNDARDIYTKTPANETESISPRSSLTHPALFTDSNIITRGSNIVTTSATDRRYLSSDSIAYYAYLSSLSKNTLANSPQSHSTPDYIPISNPPSYNIPPSDPGPHMQKES